MNDRFKKKYSNEHTVKSKDLPDRKALYDEADDFWDVGALMPRARRLSASPASRTEAVEVDLSLSENSSSRKNGVPIPPKPPVSEAGGDGEKANTSALREYKYAGCLIQNVEVLQWHTNFSYYEQFYRNAVTFERKKAAECREVQFFSYMPQYSQMNFSQLSYYLYWRSNVRKGIYLPADYSYILLYIYELINLYAVLPEKEDDKVRAVYARDMLCDIWIAYREDYPRLDIQLSEWICDLCLIHGLKIPSEKIKKIPSEIYMICTDLREFFVDCAIDSEKNHLEFANVLIAFCSNYDWRKSRYAVADALPLYECHIPNAVSTALDAMRSDDNNILKLCNGETLRSSFVGALCISKVKKRIKVKYCSFTRSYELRSFITDVIKYSENKIRAACGIKSRLSYGLISTEVRNAIDAYFLQSLPTVRHKNGKKDGGTVLNSARPEYEALYDPIPENSTLSLEHAIAIEEESWLTTDKLIEAFSDVNEVIFTESTSVSENTSEKTEPCTKDNSLVSESSSAASDLWKDELQKMFISTALHSDRTAQKAIAKASGRLCDSIADEINEFAADFFGDIILEEDDGVWKVIDDYSDEISAMLNEKKE